MRPLILLILDGWGFSMQALGNAILSSNTPHMDALQKRYPGILLQASGPSVGLLWREPGNSEVGHMTIGAGRVVLQYATRISRDIESGAFYSNPALTAAVEHTKANNSTLHIIGLLGSGSVHSLFDHLAALASLAKKMEAKSVKYHLFADGKDSGLKESTALLAKLQAKILENGTGEVASLIGRMYAMNRTGNWELTRRAYELWVNGIGEESDNLMRTITEKYDSGLTDTDLPPLTADKDAFIRDNDAVIFFNFREDSMRQVIQSFTEPGFAGFPVSYLKNVKIITLTQYLPHLPPELVAFMPKAVPNGLAEVLSLKNKKQLRIAETEKYAHATYFFNCLRHDAFGGEMRILIESYPNPVNRPEMRALDIASVFKKEFAGNMYDFFMINIANADILAHSGNLNSAIAGIEVADAAVGEIVDTVLDADGIVMITSDHGNAESMIYSGSGDAETRHNPNPVPLYLIAKEYGRERGESGMPASFHKAQGILSDVAPTILELMGIEKPPEMGGESLLNILKGV